MRKAGPDAKPTLRMKDKLTALHQEPGTRLNVPAILRFAFSGKQSACAVQIELVNGNAEALPKNHAQ
ncbi:MAG: hypothetical protein INR62_03400, partial [Rhodospirillales bacterium]|nr:hypothetical protein [Acetobacter sp.]